MVIIDHTIIKIAAKAFLSLFNARAITKIHPILVSDEKNPLSIAKGHFSRELQNRDGSYVFGRPPDNLLKLVI